MSRHRRIMFVQLKTGYDIDRGPSWICWVEFNRSWKTVRFHGKELCRRSAFDSNFVDISNGDRYWISGPKRDLSDTRYGPSGVVVVEEDACEAYEAFLQGAPFPGRSRG